MGAKIKKGYYMALVQRYEWLLFLNGRIFLQHKKIKYKESTSIKLLPSGNSQLTAGYVKTKMVCVALAAIRWTGCTCV